MNFEIGRMCRKYHLTDEQYVLLLRTTAKRMGLSELLDELEDQGCLESYAHDARMVAQAALDGEHIDWAVDLPEDKSEWPIDLAGEHAMQSCKI